MPDRRTHFRWAISHRAAPAEVTIRVGVLPLARRHGSTPPRAHPGAGLRDLAYLRGSATCGGQLLDPGPAPATHAGIDLVDG